MHKKQTPGNKKVKLVLMTAFLSLSTFLSFSVEAKTIEESLIESIHDNNYLRVKELVESGADINRAVRLGKEETTPLVEAIKSGNLKIIKYLISHGASVNLKINGKSPLHFAVGNNKPNIVKLLLASGAEVNAKDNTGWTPLMIASNLCELKIVKLLLKHKANPNIPNKYGIYPLHVATKCSPEVIKTLLSYGAKASVGKEEPVCWAIESKKNNTARLLLRNSKLKTACNGNSVLIEAIENENWPMVYEIINSYPSLINVPDIQGNYPIHLVAGKENFNVLKLLVDKFHVDVNIKDGDGCTPLCWAINGKNEDLEKEIVLFLLSRGVNPNIVSKSGFSPLHLAARFNEIKIGKVLLEQGANPFLKNVKGKTPIDIAREWGAIRFLNLINERFSIPIELYPSTLGIFHLGKDTVKSVKSKINEYCPNSYLIRYIGDPEIWLGAPSKCGPLKKFNVSYVDLFFDKKSKILKKINTAWSFKTFALNEYSDFVAFLKTKTNWSEIKCDEGEKNSSCFKLGDIKLTVTLNSDKLELTYTYIPLSQTASKKLH